MKLDIQTGFKCIGTSSKLRRVLLSNASVLLHSLEPVRVSFIVASFIVHNSRRVEGRGHVDGTNTSKK